MFFLRVYKFSFEFCWISRKSDEISKSGLFWGFTPRRRDPTQKRKSTLRRGMSTPRRDQEGGLDKLKVIQGIANLRCSVAVLRRGVALFIDMCFCHVLLFRYFEDLSIGLMRTL